MSYFAKKSKQSLLALLLMAGSALASPTDLSGEWTLRTDQSNSYPVNLQAQGNSWTGVGRSKLPILLKLNPSDLQNQWVGDLSLAEKHSVKATMKDDHTLELTELAGKGHWVLTRK